MCKGVYLVFLILPYLGFAQKSAKDFADLGEKYADKGKTNKAYQAYYKAATLAKTNTRYYLEAAYFYSLSHNQSKQKNRDETMRLYNKVFTMSPWNKEALLARADYFANWAGGQGDYKSAISDLDSLLVRDKENYKAYNMKVEIYMGQLDTANAMKTYKKALSSVQLSDVIYIYHNFGFYSYLKGWWPKGVDAFTNELRLRGDKDFKSYCHLASCYYHIGKTDSACYYYKQCDIDKFPTLKSKKELNENCK